jgi:hypothetical protein
MMQASGWGMGHATLKRFHTWCRSNRQTFSWFSLRENHTSRYSGGHSGGETALKIALSLVGAGAGAFCVFVLLEAMLRGAGSVLFRFQLSSMVAMGVFAGIAILIYVRLSRNWLSSQSGSGGYRAGRSEKKLRK